MSEIHQINQSLPSDCLHVILARLPARDLIGTVPLVCHYWKDLQPVACRRVRSLYLDEREIRNEKPLIMRRHGAARAFEMRFTRLSPAVTPELVVRFPRIKRLELYHSTGEEAGEGVRHLLKHWSPHLATLKLIYYSNKGSGGREFKAIIDLLNIECIALKRLDFTFLLWSSASFKFSFDLPLVARLKELKFQTEPSNYESLLRALRAYGTDTLKRLEVDWADWKYSESKAFLKKLANSPADDRIHQMARLIPRLSIEMTPVRIHRLCRHLPNLRILNLEIRDPRQWGPLWGYSRPLSQLTELHTLELFLEGWIAPGQTADPHCRSITPLVSVRRLTIIWNVFVGHRTALDVLVRPVELLPALETLNGRKPYWIK